MYTYIKKYGDGSNNPYKDLKTEDDKYIYLTLVIEEAKKNANRIINEALLEAEKAERDAAMIRRNVNVFKHKLKDILETQLDIVNDIEKIEL